MVCAFVAALLLASWAWLRRHPVFGFGGRALRRLLAHGDGSWTLEAAGNPETAELLPGSFVHAALVVVRYRTSSGHRLGRALFGDEAPPEQLRRLRARLLRGEKESQPTADR